jgi:hypothetical protein
MVIAEITEIHEFGKIESREIKQNDFTVLNKLEKEKNSLEFNMFCVGLHMPIENEATLKVRQTIRHHILGTQLRPCLLPKTDFASVTLSFLFDKYCPIIN